MREFFSMDGVFKTRNLVVMSLMIAIKIVLSQFSIYLTPTFQLVNFAYLPGAMVSILYGPWAAMAFGFVADTVGYIAKPAGPYFIGYALSEMAANFIYACFLYKKPLQVWRVLLARLTIMASIVFGLNFLWNMIMYGSIASKYYTGARIINNFIQLPVYVFLTTYIGRLTLQLENRWSVRRNL